MATEKDPLGILTDNTQTKDPLGILADDSQKKSQSDTSTQISSSDSNAPAMPSSTNYEWSKGIETPLARGVEGTPPFQFHTDIQNKIGTKRIGEYLSDKSREHLNAKNEVEDAKTTSQYLSQSDNFNQYMSKVAELTTAIQNGDTEGGARIHGELEQLKKLPLAISTAPKDESVMLPLRDELPYYKGMPQELKDAKTVGDAVSLAEKLPTQAEQGKAKMDNAEADINEVVTPLRKNANFTVDEKSGIHEYGVGHAFIKGALNVVDKTSKAIQMLGAKDDNELLSILKDNQGMQNIAFPEKPSGAVASLVEQGTSLAPYLLTPGLGTVGAMVTNGLMMGATGYAEGMQRGFDEKLAQTGNEQEALQTAKNVGLGSGAMSTVVGSVGLPMTSALGDIAGQKVLGTAIADANKLNLPDYLKYTLPKNSVANLPFPIQTYIDNKIAQSEGLNRGSMEGVGDQLVAAVSIGMLIDGLHYGGAKLSPKVKNIYETGIAKFGLAPTITEIGKQVEAGNITKVEADNLMKPIISKAAALEVMPTDLTPHEELKVLPVFERWVDVKKKIETAKKEKNDILLPELEAQEHEIRREAQEKLGTALSPKEEIAHEDLKRRYKETQKDSEVERLSPLEKSDMRHYDNRVATREEKIKANEERNNPRGEGANAIPQEQAEPENNQDNSNGNGIENGKEEPVLPNEENIKHKLEILNAEPLTPRQWIQQYFAGGGKIATDEMKRETGFGAVDKKTGKGTNMAEFRKRIWMHSKKGNSIHDITQALQEDWRTNHGGELSESEIRNEIIDVINSHDTPRSILEDLRKDFQVGDKVIGDKNERIMAQQEEEMAKHHEAEQEMFKDIPDEMLEEAKNVVQEIDSKPLTQEEIESEAKAYDEYFKSLSKEEQKKELNSLRYETDNTGTKGKENVEDKGTPANKEEPTKEVAPKEEAKTRTQSAKEKVAEAKAKAKAIRDAQDNKLGAIKDPIKEAEERAKADREVFDAYVDLAKAYISETTDKALHTLEEFYKWSGENIDDVKAAWEKAVEPIKSGITQERIEKELDDLGLTPIEKEEVKSIKGTWDKIRSEVDGGERNPVQDAKDFLSGEKKEFTYEDGVAATYQKAKIRNELKAQDEELANAASKNDKETYTEAAQKIAKAKDDFYTLTEAAKKGVSSGARLMRFAQVESSESYNITDVEARARAANAGFRIPEEVQKKLEDLVKQHEASELKIADYEKRLAEAKANHEGKQAVERIKKDVGKKRTIADIKVERKVILDTIREKLKESPSGTLSLADSPLAKILPDVGKLAKGYVEEGVIRLEDLVAKVHGDLKDIVDGLSERDVRDAISGYGKEPAPKKQTPEQQLDSKKLSALKNQGKLKSELEDTKSGNVKEKPQVTPPDRQLMGLRAENKRIRQNINNEIAKLEYKNRDRLSKMLDWFTGWVRWSAISGPNTLAKLGSAGALQSLIFTPTRQIIQTGIGKLPLFSRIAAKAGGEGHISVKGLAENYSTWWKKETWQDAKQKLMEGKSNIELLHGKNRPDLPENALFKYTGNLHGAIKVLPANAEYYKQVQTRSESALSNGDKLTDPEVQAKIHQQAYDDAMRNVFQNDNQVNTLYRGTIHQLENYGAGGKIAAAILKTAFPIVKVPTNVINSASSYAAGGAKALWTLRNGINALSERQADHVMRSMGSQAVGAIGAAVAIGLWKNFGGLYAKGDKRNPDDLKPGDIDVNGVHISHTFLHHPGLYTANIISETQRLWEQNKGKKGYTVFDAVAHAVAAVAKEIPMLEASGGVASQLESARPSKSIPLALEKKTANIIVPQAVQQPAKWFDDKKRYPTDFVEMIESGVPVLRENVPEKKGQHTKPSENKETKKGPMPFSVAP